MQWVLRLNSHTMTNRRPATIPRREASPWPIPPLPSDWLKFQYHITFENLSERSVPPTEQNFPQHRDKPVRARSRLTIQKVISLFDCYKRKLLTFKSIRNFITDPKIAQVSLMAINTNHKFIRSKQSYQDRWSPSSREKNLRVAWNRTKYHSNL